MKSKKLVCLLLVSALMLSVFAACNSNTGTTGDTGTTGTTGTTTTGDSGTTTTGDSGTTTATTERDYYEFNVYCNYDWWTVLPWGEDEASKWWSEKFNIKANYSKPDANADEVLNLMVTSGDLPDCIIMDRGTNNIRLAKLGLLVDLDTLKPLVDNNWYDEYIAQSTQEMLKIDGKLYGIPNWARNERTGGNEMWMYTEEIYKAAGSPTIRTFSDLYDYAVAVRDNVPKTSGGMDTIAFSSDRTPDGTALVRGFYRSFGGPTLAAGTWFGRVDGSYSFLFRDPVYRAAAMEVNKWFREGLISQTTFTNSPEQWLEQLTNARVGLIWYDMSQDDTNNFRKIVRETYPGNSIEYITFEENGTTYFNPPANGLSADMIYTDADSTVGWNVNCITTSAKKPERIFELYTHMLTKEGAINMQYGPQGNLWDELDQNGNPILKIAESDLTAEKSNEVGCWNWSQPAHSNSVDNIKFALNDLQPVDKQSWVITAQAHIMTPLKPPLSDEYTGIPDVIEAGSDLAIKRSLCVDYLVAQLPLILMADSPEKAESLYDEAIAWVDANGIKDVEAAYDVKYQANCAIQGGSVFR